MMDSKELSVSMPMEKIDPKKALDKQIEQSYCKHGNGVQIKITDIGKISDEARAVIASGLNLDEEMPK